MKGCYTFWSSDNNFFTFYLKLNVNDSLNDLDQLEDAEEIDKKLDSTENPNNFANSNSITNRFASDSLSFLSVKRSESNRIGQLNQEIADFVTDDSPSATVTELRRTIHLQVLLVFQILSNLNCYVHNYLIYLQKYELLVCHILLIRDFFNAFIGFHSINAKLEY